MSYKQGIYTPINPGKWRGNINRIIYRSSWELKFAKWADLNPKVLEVSSEEVIIPYFNPFKKSGKGGPARYFVDFWIKYKIGNGKIREALIEVKPYKNTIQPVLTKTPKGRVTEKRKRAYNEALKTYIINMSKWKAAKAHAEANNMFFFIFTERELYGKTLI
jgi:hypothetical protein